MTRKIDLRVLELLVARLCHDLVGPVAAICNGVELLSDDDPEFTADAIGLVGTSARKVNARLQFYRFAFGFGGGGLSGVQPAELAAELFRESAVVCMYSEAVRSLTLEQQKLACNMLAIGAEALPRGGRLDLELGDIGPQLDVFGESLGPSPQIRAALMLTAPVAELTSRTVGAYFTGLLAERLGWKLEISDLPGGFRLTTGFAS